MEIKTTRNNEGLVALIKEYKKDFMQYEAHLYPPEHIPSACRMYIKYQLGEVQRILRGYRKEYERGGIYKK